jgi:hypothetical protein
LVLTDEERKAKAKEYEQRPEVKLRRKEKRDRPENKAKTQEKRDRPENKAKRKLYNARPERMAKQKERAENPENKVKKKAREQTPEHKSKRKVYEAKPERMAKQKERQSRPEYKAKKKEFESRPENKANKNKLRLDKRLKVLQTYSKRLSNSNVPCCNCCGQNSHTEFLAIDHIAGKKQMDSEPELRKIGYSSKLDGSTLVKWIIDNDFPVGFQILCTNCNTAKGYSKDNKCPHESK